MELIRGLQNLQSRHRGCVATIGNFDGVHLGHQAVIGQLVEAGQQLGLPTLVITFEPQPLEYLVPDKAPARLTRFREKLRALSRYAVDRVLCIRFNDRLAALGAEDFIQQILVDGLDVKYVVVGDDFRFGKDRKGSFESLQEAGKQHGFKVVNMHTFNIDDHRVSSTRVRDALARGDLKMAERYLGRPYRMCGRVAHGDKRGRTIGVPTANIHLHRKKTPVKGVYVVEVFGLEGEPVGGVANVGTRPTVDGTRTLLEIHLFDFNQEIYGRYVHIDFIHKLRDEERYDSFEELKKRIYQDMDEARAWLHLRDEHNKRVT